MRQSHQELMPCTSPSVGLLPSATRQSAVSTLWRQQLLTLQCCACYPRTFWLPNRHRRRRSALLSLRWRFRSPRQGRGLLLHSSVKDAEVSRIVRGEEASMIMSSVLPTSPSHITTSSRRSGRPSQPSEELRRELSVSLKVGGEDLLLVLRTESCTNGG